VKRLSSARIEALALAITGALERSGGLSVTDRGAVVRAVTAALQRGFQVDGETDRRVRERIASLSRSVPEGSREWDLLYQQYSEELSRRRS